MNVLLGPENTAGQLWHYATGLRSHGHSATVLTYSPHPFGFQDDICMDVSVGTSWRSLLDIPKRSWYFLTQVPEHDVIHYSFGGTILPSQLDLRVLRYTGTKVVMNYMGSDARLEYKAAEKNPYLEHGDIEFDDDQTERRLERAGRFVDVALVPDHELYDYVEPHFDRVEVVPRAIAAEEFDPNYPAPDDREPVVVHSPSDRGVKGTRFVLDAVEELQQEFDFEFVLLENMEHEEVMATLKRADVVIDQLILGSHGVFSVEAMAMGKPVICYIREDLVDSFPDELPIVNANPDTIERQLSGLLEQPTERHRIGKASREYAIQYHARTNVADELLSVYRSL